MARGWESKAVEDQIQEAEERARRASETPLDESPEARTRRERLETLRLSRARTLDQLERATNRAHREMLGRTLRALETEIGELS
ncbi:MAG TPA: hypothetical protein VJ842_09135 [Pyrinomonadaceae bacterium]|nr:hypothetical protein [Pyrinomonadaceae bacterium]